MHYKSILKSLSLGLLFTFVQSKAIKNNCENFKSIISEYDEIKECIENRNGAITSLSFSGEPNSTIINNISTMTYLVNLEIYDGSLDNLDLQPLTNLSKLKTLHLECSYSRYGSKKYKIKGGSFKGLKKVKKLSIRGFTINETVIKDISSMPKLEDLTLQTCNHVTQDYSSLSKLQKTLKYLTIRSHTYRSGIIKEFPESILSLTKLKNLTFSYNEVDQIPSGITNLVKLESINLSNNLITELPSSLSELPKLKYIDLSGNQNLEGKAINNDKLQYCNYRTTKVCKTEELGCLDTDIPLCEIKKEVDDCTVIKNIYSERNTNVTFEEDDCNIDEKGNVTYLFFRDKKELTEEDIDKIFSYDTLTNINIYWTGSQVVMDKIPKLKNVNILTFFTTKGLQLDLTVLKNLENLTDLHIASPSSKNFHLQENSLKYLTNLKRLSFKEFGLSELMINEIGQLTQLQSLEFDSCSFKNQADYTAFENLTNLTKLYISSYNRYGRPLLEIPSSFYKLTTLKSLTLVRQYLSAISPDIINLQNLEYLNLRSNEIITLPDELNELPKLQTIYLEGNSSLQGKTLTNESLIECGYNDESTTLCKAKEMSCFSKTSKLQLC